MVIFPCISIPNSSQLLCNSSLILGLSAARFDKQILWKPLVDSSLYLSLISVGIHQHLSVGLRGEKLPQSTHVISRILSFSEIGSIEKANYGVVIKYSEFGASVILVYEDHPSPRIVELESPGINTSCLSSTVRTQRNGKFPGFF
jgi:hypothetical protein